MRKKCIFVYAHILKYMSFSYTSTEGKLIQSLLASVRQYILYSWGEIIKPGIRINLQ